ncbi:MAG: nicotinate-nucleotide--dimethylbenzimidazole phosphoribosyltransferase [Dehalococcoidia bacterium]|nr:nicotinate-nucleotide--dimethylbenzimidazole phosphoribosyltransferase [Dehalococcoidia bacterium]
MDASAKLQRLIDRIRPPDESFQEAARRRLNSLTKPRGSLGALEDLAVQLAGIRGEAIPRIRHKAIITMAADHGVAARGVSLYPQEVTSQMALNFAAGGAAINVLSHMVGARVVIVDMGIKGGLPSYEGILCKMIDFGTADMSAGPAMSREQAIDSLLSGAEVLENELAAGLDIVGAGDMGIGNTTSASAITAAITGATVREVTGRGTGIGDEQLEHKIEIIEQALAVNRPDPADALGVLEKVGGFEIGGLAGVLIAGAANRIPVVIDGFISGAAALIAAVICPQIKNHLIAAHLSAEKGHAACLKHLGLRPLLELDLRLGEGTGAALGIFLAECAISVMRDMSTFEGAGVSDIPAGGPS